MKLYKWEQGTGKPMNLFEGYPIPFLSGFPILSFSRIPSTHFLVFQAKTARSKKWAKIKTQKTSATLSTP